MAEAKAPEELFTLDLPFSGKLVTSVDGVKIEPTNFKALQNMRPVERGIRAIKGISKITDSALDYLNVVNGFQFKKDFPAESYNIIQVVNGASSKLMISDNINAVPGQDTFTDFLTLDNNETVRFSKAPNGCMMACNGTKNYIYGGKENVVQKFLNIDPTGAFKYDFSDQVSNNLTTRKALLHRSTATLAATVKALLHLDNNVTDTVGTHTPTNTGVTFSTSDKVLGTHAGVFDGSATVTIPDHADFDFSGGVFSIGGYVKSDLSGAFTFYKQHTDANNYFQVTVSTTGIVTITIVAASATTLSLATAAGMVVADRWHYVRIVENGNIWYITVDGSVRAYVSSVIRCANYNQVVTIGASLVGYMDEISVHSSAESTSFIPPLVPYSATSVAYVAVEATREIQGLKLYVATANTAAATASGVYWNGNGWSTVGTITDGTEITTGKTLSGTGTIAFTDTQSLARVKFYDSSMGYWYIFAFDNIDATTEIYFATYDANIEEVKDIWDGVYRSILSFLVYRTSYADYTVNVSERDFNSLVASTYVDINTLTSSQRLVFGFSEQVMGVGLVFQEAYVNLVDGLIPTIEIWDGQAWLDVGAVDDGTATGTITLNHNGVFSWTPPDIDDEFKSSPIKDEPMYYVSLRFSDTTTTGTSMYLDYVYGIPAQKKIQPYKFPLFWKERVLLCSNQAEGKHLMRYSSLGSNCVYNGADSKEVAVGDDSEIIAGSILPNRFQDYLYDNAVLAKRKKTIMLDIDPNDTASFKQVVVSENTGCIAPLSMVLCDLGTEIAKDIKRHVLAWVSDSGLTIYDGSSILIKSDDIKDYFDNETDTATHGINKTYIHLCHGSFDPNKYEYTLLAPIDGSTTLNGEIAYSLKAQKFYLVDRKSSPLQCIWRVEDTLGNQYRYAGTLTGYVVRLEYGTAIIAESIECIVETPDICLMQKAGRLSSIEWIRLIGKGKTGLASTIAVVHIADGVTETALESINQISTGNFQVYVPLVGQVENAVFHGFRFTVSTTDKTIPFEPLLLTIGFKDAGEVYT